MNTPYHMIHHCPLIWQLAVDVGLEGNSCLILLGTANNNNNNKTSQLYPNIVKYLRYYACWLAGTCSAKKSQNNIKWCVCVDLYIGYCDINSLGTVEQERSRLCLPECPFILPTATRMLNCTNHTCIVQYNEQKQNTKFDKFKRILGTNK